MRKTQERRRHRREEMQGTMLILWQDMEGPERIARAQCLDVSEQGLRLLVQERLPSRAMVSFNCHDLRISGRGTVRFCYSKKAAYEIGVECLSGTGWRTILSRLQGTISTE